MDMKKYAVLIAVIVVTVAAMNRVGMGRKVLGSDAATA